MTTADTGLDPGLVSRYQELTRRARRLRGTRGLSRSQWMLVLGAVGISAGLLLVVLGYLGASHTIYVFEQIPYLISGGLLGGCLVVAGSLTYFGYWLTRVHAESQRAATSLERMEKLLTVLVERGTL
jgi:hypothetical protein